MASTSRESPLFAAQPISNKQAPIKFDYPTHHFKVEPLVFNIDCHINGQFFSRSVPQTEPMELLGTKNGAENGHFQPVFGPIVLKVEDKLQCVKQVPPSAAFLSKRLNNEMTANGR